jgi:hypothetical protein
MISPLAQSEKTLRGQVFNVVLIHMRRLSLSYVLIQSPYSFPFDISAFSKDLITMSAPTISEAIGNDHKESVLSFHSGCVV